jgi:IS66 C-terminal element
MFRLWSWICGETLTENVAILSWIADQTEPVSPGPLARYRLLQALAYISAEIHKSFKPYFAPATEEAKAAAGHALRGVALGRSNWTFAGSGAGGRRAAAVYTLIEACELNDVDPQAWLAFVLAKLPDYPAKQIPKPLLATSIQNAGQAVWPCT